MAISQTIVTSTAAPANYHRVVSVEVSWAAKVFKAVLAAFYSKDARDSNAGAMQSNEYVQHGRDFSLEDEQATLAKFLGLSGGQELQNLRLTYTATDVHITANIAHLVANSWVSHEMQCSVKKVEFPVDFLKKAYALVAQDSEYQDGEVV